MLVKYHLTQLLGRSQHCSFNFLTQKRKRNPKSFNGVSQKPSSIVWTTLSLGFVLDYCQANTGVFYSRDKGCFIPDLTGLTSREGFVGATLSS